MNKNKNYFEILVGFFVLLCAMFFLFGSIKTANIKKTDDGYILSANFNNAGGIAVGSDVKIAGVKVGAIVSMALDPQSYQAKITFSIANNIKIPSDSSAKIASDGLLGGKFLSLEIGGSDEYLSENQEIAFTQSSVNFEDLLGKFIFGNESKSTNKGNK